MRLFVRRYRLRACRHDRLGAGRLRRLDQAGDGYAPILIPVVERIDLAEANEAQAPLARHFTRAGRRHPVEQGPAEIVSGLDADAAKLGGEVEKPREIELRRRPLV